MKTHRSVPSWLTASTLQPRFQRSGTLCKTEIKTECDYLLIFFLFYSFWRRLHRKQYTDDTSCGLFLNGISFMDPCKYTVILISMPSRRFKEVWKGATTPVWIIQQVNGWTGPRTAQSFGSRMGWGSRLCGTHDCIKEHFGKKNKKRLHFVSIYATSQRLCNIALLVRTRHCRLWIFTVWVCHVR